jgi:lipopolysaccharide heptosyltransferase II
MTDYSNILIVKPGAIGDLLQITPVIRALKRAFPRSSITMLVATSATASLFSHNPLVDETMVFDRRGDHRSLSALAGLWRQLHRARFDLVLNFQRSNLKGWLLVAAAIPCRVLVYHKARARSVHAVVNYLETLAPLGIPADDTALEFCPGPEAEARTDELFAAAGLTGRTVVALNPGASHPVNRWGLGSFARLADLLTERLGVAVVLVGGREDRGLAEEIFALSTFRPLVLTGETDLLQLGAVLKRCRLLVSGDTGPMHMATAVNTRVVALFGAADPARTGPVGPGHRVIQAGGTDCVPCRSRRCSNGSNLACMENITVEEVFSAVDFMLKDAEE